MLFRSGQGLPLLISSDIFSKSVGIDINPLLVKAFDSLRKKLGIDGNKISTNQGSILDKQLIAELIKKNNYQKYKVVYSWGVLHHTGSMMGTQDATSC